MKKILVGIFLMICLTGMAWPPMAPAQMVTDEWTCSPPTEGSAAVYYEWGLIYTSAPGDTILLSQLVYAPEPINPVATITWAENEEIIVVVRAKDMKDRFGPWVSSDPVTVDPGPPGGCSLIRRLGID